MDESTIITKLDADIAAADVALRGGQYAEAEKVTAPWDRADPSVFQKTGETIRQKMAMLKFLRGQALMLVGAPKNAIRLLDEGIQLGHDVASSHWYRAEALKSIQRYEEAIAAYRAALRLREP